ncbi:LamG-like jellyroll fold domain-containing protein [Poriferisphaera sp. WC338]|uniref:LamG domain-containing protein n=1 Tax=Poriferisphaera sp. WC338 TaxID=3425129 RepID=UPI003D8181A8
MYRLRFIKIELRLSKLFQSTVGIVLLLTLVSTAFAQGSQNLINVSWGDQILIGSGNARLDTAEKIRNAMEIWDQNNQGNTILWRTGAYEHYNFFDGRRYTKPNYWSKLDQIYSEFDPIAVARQAASQNGQTFLGYTTVFDHGAPASVQYDGRHDFVWQDRATINNPSYQVKDRLGNYQYGVLEFANPSARQFMVDRLKFFANEWDMDGVYIDTRTHSIPAEHADQFGFGSEVVSEYQNRYGINILTDSRFDYTSSSYNPNHQVVENWRKLRGEYLIEFYREARAAMPDKIIYTSIPRGDYLGDPYGNLHIDWQTLVNEKLVDGLVIGVSTGIQHPNLAPDPNTAGYLSSESANINIPTRDDAVANIYGPVTQSNSVKLFFDTKDFAPNDQQFLSNQPALDGVMIQTPSGTGGGVIISQNDAFDFSGGKMTLEAFVKAGEGNTGGQRILSKYDHNDNGRNRGWEWIVSSEGNLQFRVQQVGGEVKIDSNTTLPVGAWVHVATVYDATNDEMRIYLDGELDSVLAIDGTSLNSTPDQDLFVGRYGGFDGLVFDGQIDELRITADALIFDGVPQQPYTGTEPDTIALYHFDEIVDGEFVNSAEGSIEDAFLLAGGDQAHMDSQHGFGKALNIGFIINPIPEPTTMTLLSLLGTVLLGKRWYKAGVR